MKNIYHEWKDKNELKCKIDLIKKLDIIDKRSKRVHSEQLWRFECIYNESN